MPIYENQTRSTIAVFEGESSRSCDNNLLGEFVLTGIPPAPRGVPNITICLDIDADGILTVFAEEKASGSKNQITISNNMGGLRSAEIHRLVREAEKYRLEDEKHKKKVELRNSFELYAMKMRKMISNSGETLPLNDQKKIESAVYCAIHWLGSNEHAKIGKINREMKALQNVCDPIIDKLYQQGGTNNGPLIIASCDEPKILDLLRFFGFFCSCFTS